MAVLKREGITFPARVVKHDTKSMNKDGVAILKVGLELDCVVGGQAVHTLATLAFRCEEPEIENWPLNDDFEVTIRSKAKPS